MSNINNLLHAKSITETRKATTAVRNYRRRIKADGIYFVKTNKLFILLPNNHVSVAPKIVRDSVDLTYASRFRIPSAANFCVHDNDHEFSPYKCLARSLEMVKEKMLCGELTLPSFFDRITSKGRAGVCFDNGRWSVTKNSYNEDLRNLKTGRERFKTQAAAERYAQGIVDRNKEFLLTMMDKHIHLLRTDPNALPVYDQAIHGEIVLLDSKE